MQVQPVTILGQLLICRETGKVPFAGINLIYGFAVYQELTRFTLLIFGGVYSPASAERSRAVSKRNYWLLFGAVQIVGAVVPYFGNVHMNIVPVILGVLLLLPGVLVDSIYPPNVAPWLQVSSVILINAAVWYVFRKILLASR